MTGGLSRSTQPHAMISWKSSKSAMDAAPRLSHPSFPSTVGTKSSAIRPTPTPSWTVSSTTLIASNSPAKACVGPKQRNRGRLDPTPQPATTIHRPARLATRAASFRYGGDIIQESRAALSRYTRAASSESATLRNRRIANQPIDFMARAKGFEPSTPTLARLRTEEQNHVLNTVLRLNLERC